MLIFQFNQEKLDNQGINLTPEVLAFWNGYIKDSKDFVLLPPYIDYICNTEENTNYDVQFVQTDNDDDDDDGSLTF